MNRMNSLNSRFDGSQTTDVLPPIKPANPVQTFSLPMRIARRNSTLKQQAFADASLEGLTGPGEYPAKDFQEIRVLTRRKVTP